MRSVSRLLSRSLRALNKFNVIPYIFLVFMLRLTITGASIGDAIAAIAVCGLVAAKLHFDHIRKPDLMLGIAQDIAVVKEEVAMLKLSSSKKSPTFSPRPDQRLF